MNAPEAPRLDRRRTADFSAELRARARAWIPSWGLVDGERDFGRALLEIAARFNAEVAERLDGAGEKMRRGFLDWLAVRGEAARPARMPVAFKLTDAAQSAVLAEAPVRLQADAAGTPVVFETERDVRIVPGRLEILVAVDADRDEFFLAPPGLSDLQPLEPMPTRWQTKSFASAGSTKLQLDPEGGLAPDTILETGGHQYRIVQADKGLVTLDPPLDGDAALGASVFKVGTFTPFGGSARNWQAHALYFGDADVLNVEAAATIEIVGGAGLENAVWQYWGKVGESDQVGWQPLTIVAPSTSQQASGGIVLYKSAGSVEQVEIDGKSSRWIRAYRKQVPPIEAPFTADTFTIRINSANCDPDAVKCPPTSDVASPAAEGMANNTPLVLDNVFFPLGKEPKQFDAFYLGSQEVFSKKGANVQLCFEIADPTFAALSIVPGGAFGNRVLAGVAKDRALHLLDFNASTAAVSDFRSRGPLQPPTPGFEGNTASGNQVPLDSDPQPRWRVPVWSESDGFLVAVSAGDAIWAWHEKDAEADRTKSGWVSFGSIPATTPPATTPVSGLVYLDDPGTPQLVALRNRQMAVRDRQDGAQWAIVPTSDAFGPVDLESLVPVLEETASGLVTSVTAGMVGVSSAWTLFSVTADGDCAELSPTQVDKDVRPVAVETAAGDLIVVALEKGSQRDLVVFHSVHGEAPVQMKEADARVLGLAAVLDTVDGNAVLEFLASVQTGGDGYLASFAPHDVMGGQIEHFQSVIPAGVGIPGGSPTGFAHHVVVPGTRGDVLVSQFDLAERVAHDALIEPGIVVAASSQTLVPNDVVTRMVANVPEPQTIADYGTTLGAEVFHPIQAAFSANATGPLLAYRASAPLTGSFVAADKLQLQSGDHEATEHSFLLVDGAFYEITHLDRTDPWTATLSPNPGGTGTVPYNRALPTGGRTAPFMRLNPSGNGKWNASLLDRVPLYFPGATPSRQMAKAFAKDTANHPTLVVLTDEFAVAPAGSPTFIIDAAGAAWSRALGDTSTNPELSWEYWNGKGWWRLDVTLDETLNFKRTGAIRFAVPDDLVSSDWSGKTNHWIRARLIGGDYGKEKVTVTTTPIGDGKTEQTVDRSQEGIRAPSVLKLHISYALCSGVEPTFVLTEDSGSVRDQSDANRTAGAIVEAFVSLAVMLGRLSGPAAAAQSAPSEDCPPECACGTANPATAAAPSQPAAAPPDSPTAVPSTVASGRAIFVGLDAALTEAPVNVLMLVDERTHTALAPMTIAALIADRFQPIVADDGTRALGESGVLSMSFPIQPTARELFGRQLSWLRLLPASRGEPDTSWNPAVRGAYLNAVWAGATETLTRELLGSSEGAPNLVVRVARPPVLRDSLELRVKEPLGDEDRAAIREGDRSTVLTEPDGLPGDWVLWTRATEPLDQPPDARVYALDELTGEIRFGDGLHGMIPPIGRDSIVAFSYRRTEPGPPDTDVVPANAIAARTALNLVSPLETVEAVFSADQAAGGAPAERADRVVRFGFARVRHRGRAVTARDIEDLALQSSPDIVQARCFQRKGYVRLVIVMKGHNPQPSAAQVRELKRLLLDAGPASLAAPEALRISGPRVRNLRVDLRLRIETLDEAGALGRAVKKQLAAFFDTATGGTDRDGWPLGWNPTEEDIALALIDAPHLESIATVAQYEIVDDVERPWPSALKPTDLAVLDDDPVRMQFDTAEVLA